MKSLIRLSLLFAPCALSLVVVARVGGQPPEPQPPKIADASEEGEQNLQAFRIAPGLVGSLFAAEPLVANPVSFFVDSQARLFVCESFRQNQGVTDNRGHDQAWLDDDLAAQTVEDRRAYHQKHLGDNAGSYMEQDDRIRLLLDTNGDGRADTATVFADHFNDLVDGTGAGVMEWNGNVYYTCIPKLWMLRDDNHDGVADIRQWLHTGYGVRVAFRGHDMHGLQIGPDGRLYFSIGDRGANVETPGGVVKNVESGSVFRCEPDGSQLEIFATGLRNPQELVFDEFGNLFTGDNNSDSGDRARWVYVAEGGDSGWRMAYQYLGDRGPFNREKIWHPFHDEQPAFIVPPIANFADGPSGLDYYPGTGFGDQFQGRFFLVDFRGTPGQSGVRSFRVENDGAFFKLVDDQQPIWRILATDVQFGPDGYLYVSDWVNGWDGEGKGRIYRFSSPDHVNDPAVAEVRALLAESLEAFTPPRLAGLLAHRDQRVRQKAQFALVKQNEIATLRGVATQASAARLPRLHAMWGLEQIVRQQPPSQAAVGEVLRGLLADADAEVRAQAARLAGEIDDVDAGGILKDRLQDENSRVRYFAALSLGQLADTTAFDAVVAMLAENNNRDPILRHGGVMALRGLASAEQLTSLTTHASPAVRRAAVVALRRQQSPQVAAFLHDASIEVALEAARAIHDQPIPTALAALAAAEISTADDAFLRRRLNACYRLGGPENAARLANFAADSTQPAAMRLEAIAMLGEWAKPNSRDRVLGMWRPIEARDDQVVAAVLQGVMDRFQTADADLRLAIAKVASRHGIRQAAPLMREIITNDSLTGEQRSDALSGLRRAVGNEALDDIQGVLDDKEAVVRGTALELLAELDPESALPRLAKVALAGEPAEQQAAFVTLGKMPGAEADKVLAEGLQALLSGDLKPEAHLDLLEATTGRDNKQLRELREVYEARRDPAQPSDMYREALYGGNAARGRQLFQEKAAVSCVRCHRVFRTGGEVGPELTRIGADKDRQYLLESIVDPNKAIAKGFESVAVVDENGRTFIGVLREESDEQLTLIDANANVLSIAKDEIVARRPSPSAMPVDLVTHLTKRELRDLIEYLSSLNGRFRFRRQREPL